MSLLLRCTLATRRPACSLLAPRFAASPSPFRTFSSAPAPPTIKDIYEGPFAGTTLRLKRVSVMTATIGLFGMPLLVYLNTGTPLMGTLAVSGTATLAAVGSTVLLNYCVTPYVHTITTTDDEMYTATTATMYGTRKQTDFALADVVGTAKAKSSRPFCNFTAKDTPMYIHPEIFNDKNLLKQLLQRPLTKPEMEGRAGDSQ